MNQPLLLGIEIGGTKLQAALGDSCGRIAHLSQTSANPEGGATAIVNQLEEMIEELLKFLISKVDTNLFKAIVIKYFKSSNV